MRVLIALTSLLPLAACNGAGANNVMPQNGTANAPIVQSVNSFASVPSFLSPSSSIAPSVDVEPSASPSPSPTPSADPTVAPDDASSQAASAQ
jgi:hypothetical protein